jgi:hypothetical protein
MQVHLNSGKSRVWRYVLGVAGLLVVVGGIGIAILSTHLTPIVRGRALDMLRSRFDSEAEIHEFRVSLLKGISVQGEGLILHYRGRTDIPPLIEVREFSANMAWLSLMRKPWNIRNVQLAGLTIHIPPKEERTATAAKTPRLGARDVPVLVNELVSDDAELDLIPSDPQKSDHRFLIHHLAMHGVGLGQSASFTANLTNATPPGQIITQGHFGPWQIDDPGATPLSANYTFQNADLGVFRGIAGILSSRGKFGGILEDIDVQGNTDTPDFTVSIVGHPVHLKTDFQATVDGTNGDTVLHPVIAEFLHTRLVCNGGVVKGANGEGREIVLDVAADQARLEDLLRLVLKSDQTMMTGAVRIKTKFDLPPGPGEIVDRLRLDGSFGVGGAEFASADIRQKLEGLSRRGQGKPQDEDAGSAVSELKGHFKLQGGQITFHDLTFGVTGATVELAGTYGLRDEKLDFHGTLRLQAKLSRVTTGIKSFLLKPFDPFFRKNGVTVLPIKVTGTRDQPSFGLDFHRNKDQSSDASGD